MAVEPAVAYQVLGLPSGASCEEVRKAFLRLSLQLHPDKSSSRTATADFQCLLAAYEVVKLQRNPALKRPFGETETHPTSEYHHREQSATDRSEDDEEYEEEGERENPHGWEFPHSCTDDDEEGDEGVDVENDGAPEASYRAAEAACKARYEAVAAAMAEAAAAAALAQDNARKWAAEAAAAAEAKAVAAESARRAAAAAEADAARRRAPLEDLQRRIQEHMRLLLAVRAADASATARAKLGFTDLMKNLGNCRSSLEQLVMTSEAARALHDRWMTEVGEVLARHLPQEEREHKRSQAFFGKSARLKAAGRSISAAEQKLNDLYVRKAAERYAAVAKDTEAQQNAAADATDQHLAARITAVSLLDKATAHIEICKAAQEEANTALEVRRGAEEQLLLLRIASAKVSIQLSSGTNTQIGQGALQIARQKYQLARQDLKRLQNANLQSSWSAEATRCQFLANEEMRGLRTTFGKMSIDVDSL